MWVGVAWNPKHRVEVSVAAYAHAYSPSAQRLMYYVNDGMYGSFGCILYEHAHPIPRLLTPTSEGCDQYECSMWGHTCDGLDQILDCGTLPELAVGEWVVFEDMGAYTISISTAFNGFQKPNSFFYVTEECGNELLVEPGRSVGPVQWKPVEHAVQYPHSEQLCPS